MKLNFFNLLAQDKATPEQIGQEITLLENRMVQAKAEKQKLQETGREMRAKQLCGALVSVSEIRGIKESLAQIDEDLIVFADNFEKLTAKLLVLLEERNMQEWEQWRKGRQELLAQDQEYMRELAKLNGRVSVLRELMGDCIGRGTLTEQEMDRISAEERKGFWESLPKPTCADKATQLTSQEADLKSFNAQKAMGTLLKRYRQPLLVEQEASV